MATATKRKRNQSTQLIEDFLGRVTHAIEVLQIDPRPEARIRRAAVNAESPVKKLRVAETLGVDPRWLATGIVSRAGAAAREFMVDKLRYFARDEDEGVAGLRLLPEPDLGAGVCRYCLCDDDHSCGDCVWLDAAGTICSACLAPEDLV